MNELKSYYFTFGQDHPLQDWWLEIQAPTYWLAREKMVKMHGSKWASQYEDVDFEPKLFPRGRFGEVIEIV